MNVNLHCILIMFVVLEGAGVQPPQDPGEPEGKMASADDLERDKERML